MTKIATKQSPVVRPPIVAVLGHVDHGKTSLLDTIRKSAVAAREHGGITQHIGAYQISFVPKQTPKTTRFITFIDTPGHEAFIKMRSRGAQVADIAILVVAADDSVMPQTKESIEQIRKAGVPLIVAMNKIDLPAANPQKVKQDLAKVGVQVEGFGGDTPIVSVSAKNGTGITDLLDMILLVWDMNDKSVSPEAGITAPVIETRLDKGKGMVATLVVHTGTIKNGTVLYEGMKQVAKVRAMFDEYGKIVKEALPSRPVEVLGFTRLPEIGTVLRDSPVEPVVKESLSAQLSKEPWIPDFLKPVSEQEKPKLSVMLKADTAGSLEAITESLDERIHVVSQGVGEITEADILEAKAHHAFVIGFNIHVKPTVEKLAQAEKVIFRTYTIIYELLDEMAEVVAGMKEVITHERELGQGRIIAEFPFDKQRVAGTKVTAGRIARGDQVRVMRGDTEIGRAKIKTIRHGREEVTKIETNGECGILFDRKVDFQLDDDIIAFTLS